MRKSLMLMGILNDADLEWLIRTGESRRVAAGTVLIREAEPVEYIYILLEGRLAVSVASMPGKAVAVLDSGEIVGEISFVDSRPPLASVHAVNDVHVLAVSRQKLGLQLERDAGFAARFYKGVAFFLADRLRTTTARFGYGATQQDAHQADEMNDDMMDNVASAAARFDMMLRRVR
jgi:CRP/FNR family transcriptional regulator, cyclic AMP receptor protein